MAHHIDLGRKGEELAATWLAEQGYKIIHRNWRNRKYEIDIIATKGKFLHFIEVKSRTYTPYDFPESNVTRKKFKSLQKAAHEFLYQNPGHPWIQYSIVAISFHPEKDPDIFFIEDVFL